MVVICVPSVTLIHCSFIVDHSRTMNDIQKIVYLYPASSWLMFSVTHVPLNSGNILFATAQQQLTELLFDY